VRIKCHIERVEDVAPFQGRFHTRSRRCGDGHLHVASSQHIASCVLGPPLACVVSEDTYSILRCFRGTAASGRERAILPTERRRQHQQYLTADRRGGEPPRMENMFVAYCTKVPVDLLAIVPEHCRRATVDCFPHYYTKGRRCEKCRVAHNGAKPRLDSPFSTPSEGCIVAANWDVRKVRGVFWRNSETGIPNRGRTLAFFRGDAQIVQLMKK
jgi:hypothetical protein